MTRRLKLLVDGALEGAGRVVMQHELSSEPQWIDVWFEPTPGAHSPPGLLGRMAAEACAFEIFHAPPAASSILRCLSKMLRVSRRRGRAARTGAQAGEGRLSPMVVSAGRPFAALEAIAAAHAGGWPEGVYRMTAPALPLYVVVVSELPRDRSTLVLRLMGARHVLREALEQLAGLPPDAWERAAATDSLRVLHSFASEAAEPMDPDEKGIIMSARETYEQIKNEGRTDVLLRQLARRFGEIPPDVMTRLKTASSEQLGRWAERVLTATTLADVLASED
jgi:hypothetical protein